MEACVVVMLLLLLEVRLMCKKMEMISIHVASYLEPGVQSVWVM